MSTLESFLTATPMALSFLIFLALLILIACNKCKWKLWAYWITYIPCYIIDIFAFIFVPNTADEIVLPIKIVSLIVPIIYSIINFVSSKRKNYVVDDTGNIVEDGDE